MLILQDLWEFVQPIDIFEFFLSSLLETYSQLELNCNLIIHRFDHLNLNNLGVLISISFNILYLRTEFIITLRFSSSDPILFTFLNFWCPYVFLISEGLWWLTLTRPLPTLWTDPNKLPGFSRYTIQSWYESSQIINKRDLKN